MFDTISWRLMVPTLLAVGLLTIGNARAAQICGGAPKLVSESMFNSVNAARKTAGLPALKEDRKLARAAQEHACDMAKNGYFAHQDLKGRNVMKRVSAEGYRSCVAAENLGFGWRTVDQVMKDLMNSPHHRENILRRSVKAIGIGYVPPSNGQGPWWVQVFADPC